MAERVIWRATKVDSRRSPVYFAKNSKDAINKVNRLIRSTKHQDWVWA